MIQRIPKARMGEIFEKLYESEINIRFEWLVEGGYTWSIVGSSHERLPRVLVDDESSAGFVVIKKDIIDYDEQIGPPNFIEPDWLKRGNNEEIELALGELVSAISEIFPNSAFVKWFKEGLN